jgi:hypothetical protein
MISILSQDDCIIVQIMNLKPTIWYDDINMTFGPHNLLTKVNIHQHVSIGVKW